MTHKFAYALCAADCVAKLASWQAQRPHEHLAFFSVKRIGAVPEHWYLEASYAP